MAKIIYQADDGTQFENEQDMYLYESQAGKKNIIKAWVEQQYNNVRVTKKNLNVIMMWESQRDAALSAIPEQTA